MRKALVFLSFFMFCLTAIPQTTIPPDGQVTIQTDEFTKEIVIRYSTPHFDGGNLIHFMTMKARSGHVFPVNVLFDFASTTDWEYLKCHSVQGLADDVPLVLSDAEHDGEVGEGYVSESVTTDMELSEFKKLAFAKEAKFRVCNTVFTLTPEMLANLQLFYAAATEDTQGKRAEKQTAPPPAIGGQNESGNYKKGVEALDAGKAKEAATLFEKAIQDDPKDADAHRELARCLAQTGDYAGAVSHLKTYLKIRPDAPDADQWQAAIQALEPLANQKK